jgi:hypothetical protein
MDLAGDVVRHVAIEEKLHPGLPAFEIQVELGIARGLLCEGPGEGLHVRVLDPFGSDRLVESAPCGIVPSLHELLQLFPKLRASRAQRPFGNSGKRSEEDGL